jgi:hypothetical protein
MSSPESLHSKAEVGTAPSQYETVSEAFKSFEYDPNIESLITQLTAAGIPDEDIKAVELSISGNRSLVDERLRDKTLDSKFWIVKVPEEIGSDQSYAWTVASVDDTGRKVQDISDEFYQNARRDNVLACPDDYRSDSPPPIVWLKPYFSSPIPQPPAKDAQKDEFYIFQVPRSADEPYIDDFDQSLVLNTEKIKRGLEVQLSRMKSILDLSDTNTSEILSLLENNVAELAFLHLELHNTGHFLGPMPFDERKRDHNTYDFIEELRACLCAFRTAHVNGLEGNNLTALGLQIIGTRLFLHGFNAWSIPDGTRSREEVREVVVASILWERLVTDQAVTYTENGFAIDSKKFNASFFSMLDEIHSLELTASTKDKKTTNLMLKTLSVKLIKAAFSGKEYRPSTVKVFETIKSTL